MQGKNNDKAAHRLGIKEDFHNPMNLFRDTANTSDQLTIIRSILFKIRNKT